MQQAITEHGELLKTYLKDNFDGLNCETEGIIKKARNKFLIFHVLKRRKLVF